MPTKTNAEASVLWIPGAKLAPNRFLLVVREFAGKLRIPLFDTRVPLVLFLT
jgi:hypothetical protein